MPLPGRAGQPGGHSTDPRERAFHSAVSGQPSERIVLLALSSGAGLFASPAAAARNRAVIQLTGASAPSIVLLAGSRASGFCFLALSPGPAFWTPRSGGGGAPPVIHMVALRSNLALWLHMNRPQASPWVKASTWSS